MKEISEGIRRDSDSNVKPDEQLSKETLERILVELNNIISKEENFFVWFW